MDPAGLAPRVVETHVSTVLLVGDRALKFPKPVRNEFLDQSTPALRRTACEEELRLNRRLAPDVYLGIGEVHEGDEIADWFLVMRRMPDAARLSDLASTPVFDDALREVVRTIAAFHAAQPPSGLAASLATQDATRSLWTEKNLEQMRRFAGTLLDAADLDEIEQLARASIDGRGPVFARRIEAGCARDGHGDLLADDIYVLPDGPRVLDCIAFDESLRCGDVLLDIAFLAMDVERLAGPAATDAVFAWYAELTGERHPRSLAHLFVAYRALVRAKVNCLQAEQGIEGAAARARAFLAQCLAHLRRAVPVLVLVGGAPGTGKSTVAARLADAATGAAPGATVDLTVLGSDELRKELAGVDPATPLEREVHVHAGAYAPEARAGVYDELLRRAAVLLSHGESVVLDATWSTVETRAAAARVAHETHSRLVAVRCVLDEPTAAARVHRRRRAGSSASDADEAVAAAIASTFAPWPDAVEVDTSPDPETVASSVRALAARLFP